MAGRRRTWESLTAAYRGRLTRAGVTKGQYQSGANLSKARGHAQTPEHPREAQRNPERYRKYVQKRQQPARVAPGRAAQEDEAYARNALRDNAYRNFVGQLGHYIKFNRETVTENVYNKMTDAQAKWTIHADAEEIRSMASDQYKGNPWWYH